MTYWLQRSASVANDLARKHRMAIGIDNQTFSTWTFLQPKRRRCRSMLENISGCGSIAHTCPSCFALRYKASENNREAELVILQYCIAFVVIIYFVDIDENRARVLHLRT